MTCNKTRNRSGISAARTLTIMGLAAAILMLIIFSASCSKDQPGSEKEPLKITEDTYRGWSDYTYGHFVFHLSPNTPYAVDKADLARGYERFLTEICSMLEMPVPEDNISLYVYAGPPEIERITGRAASFSTDSAVHWAGERRYGYELTKLLMGRKGIQPGQFRVVYEGLANLLDFSSQNYHNLTAGLVVSGKFVGLADLGNNAVFDTLKPDIQRCESASLVGFIMYTYDLEHLIRLGNSLGSWNEAVEAVFGVKFEELEKNWVDFAREHPDNPAPASPADTVK